MEYVRLWHRLNNIQLSDTKIAIPRDGHHTGSIRLDQLTPWARWLVAPAESATTRVRGLGTSPGLVPNNIF